MREKHHNHDYYHMRVSREKGGTEYHKYALPCTILVENIAGKKRPPVYVPNKDRVHEDVDYVSGAFACKEG